MNAEQLWSLFQSALSKEDLESAEQFLTLFKSQSDKYPNLIVQYDQLRRQLELAKG